MDAQQTFGQQFLAREAAAWRDLPPAQYDQTLCALLDEARAAASSDEQVDALFELASTTLRRPGPTLSESRRCAAEHLLSLATRTPDPARLARLRLLFLLAWLQLGALVERGPESVAVAPSLPEGVVLPAGAALEAIADPALREAAHELAARHAEKVERWNAKQRALGHLQQLASSYRAARSTLGDNVASEELEAAMVLAPGLPVELREGLAGAA
jgi:hypothetical protein